MKPIYEVINRSMSVKDITEVAHQAADIDVWHKMNGTQRYCAGGTVYSTFADRQDMAPHPLTVAALVCPYRHSVRYLSTGDVPTAYEDYPY